MHLIVVEPNWRRDWFWIRINQPEILRKCWFFGGGTKGGLHKPNPDVFKLPPFALTTNLPLKTVPKPEIQRNLSAWVTDFTAAWQWIEQIHGWALSAHLRFQLLIFGNGIMITHNSMAVALLFWKIRLSARALHCHLATIPSPEANPKVYPRSAYLAPFYLAANTLMPL